MGIYMIYTISKYHIRGGKNYELFKSVFSNILLH